MPLFQLIARHVLAAERLHVDDTTIRIQAKDKCATGRIWTIRATTVPAPLAAMYYGMELQGWQPCSVFFATTMAKPEDYVWQIRS